MPSFLPRYFHFATAPLACVSLEACPLIGCRWGMEGWIGGCVVAWTFQPWTSCNGPSLTVDEEDGLVGWVVVPPTMEKHCAMRPPVKGIAMWQHFCRCPHEQFSTHILFIRICVVVYNFSRFLFCKSCLHFAEMVNDLQMLFVICKGCGQKDNMVFHSFGN